ncbi:MAG TPA: hypothetical protein VG370_29130 [Chloroflexota bacterium]|nr:hypothetical protein [Chloroflexota bacterium]
MTAKVVLTDTTAPDDDVEQSLFAERGRGVEHVLAALGGEVPPDVVNRDVLRRGARLLAPEGVGR